jgi:RHS repeat-associated protein
MRKRFLLGVLFQMFLMGTGSLLGQMPVVPGDNPNANPEGNTGALKAQIETGGSYDAHSGNGTRIVNDLHVPDALGVYGLDFTRYWNSVRNDDDDSNADWSMDFGASGWSHSWKWTALEGNDVVQLDEGGGADSTQIYITSITITFPDGHATKYRIERADRTYIGQPWPADPHWGAPYHPEHGESSFHSTAVTDFLDNMAEDGSEFWLHRADGGSVHFVKREYLVYEAREIFDPHGLKTQLFYDERGYLYKVEQEGGRWLAITWGTHTGWAAPVITRVQTGGYAAGQSVSYKYSRFPDAAGSSYVLAAVGYPNEPAPGQTAWAVYSYGTCTGDDPEPCNTWPTATPLLKYAADPHFAGAMTKIRYAYQGASCPNPAPGGFNGNYFPANAFAIWQERSGETGQPVTSFSINCFDGTRLETNGFNAQRQFYFGTSAPPRGGMGYHCLGFQLAGLTDFTYLNPYPTMPPQVPAEYQNYVGGHPRQIWDGRNIMIESLYQDSSGSPTEIRYLVDGSTKKFNHTNSNGSPGPDQNRIHNPYQHWLFSTEDENHNITTYRRDERRRVTRIDYPDTGVEEFVYDGSPQYNPNGLNQITSHTLPTGATVTYEYDFNNHRLMSEYNSVDGLEARKDYTYDSLGRVATVADGRARAAHKDFSTRMTYNGRHQVLTVEYAGMSNASDNPKVEYRYDSYGNCTVIIDELGHRKDFTYDSYRRCTKMVESLNAPAPNGSGTVPDRTWEWHYDRDIETNVGLHHFLPSTHTSKEWRVQIEPVFDDAGGRRVSAQKFDQNNRVIEASTGLYQASNGEWFTTDDTEVHSFTYDENGQKQTFTDSRGRRARYEYNLRNRLTKVHETENSVERITETLYDRAGNKTDVIFPDSTSQHWSNFNGLGLPRTFIDERNQTTNLEYWNWGPMKKLAIVQTHRTIGATAPEEQTTRFYYDGMGRPQRTTFPDNNFEYTGYKFGQVDFFQTRKGYKKTIEYDARGREISHTWNDGGMTSGIVRTWDDANRLETLTNDFSAIDFQYDDAGQVLWEGDTVRGASGPNDGRRQLTYNRYPSGEVSRLIYPNGLIVNRTYTTSGRLKSTTWPGGSVDYAYLKDGKLDFQDYGNGVRSDFGYNPRGFIDLTNTYKVSSGLTYSKRDYWRDDRDRITAWKRGTDYSLNRMEDGRGDRYKYDPEGQLERASYRAPNPEASATPAMRSDSFQYDELGNRVGPNWVANRAQTMNFVVQDSKLNQYGFWNPYSIIRYDNNIPEWGGPDHANGVLMQDGNITAGFNSLNQPIAAMSHWTPPGLWVHFGYDPLGRPVKRWYGPDGTPPPNSNPATYLYYDGWNLVQEGDGTGAVSRQYVHGNRVDEIVADRNSANQWAYHHYDARGHCILLTGASDGALIEQYEFDAFGFPYYSDKNGIGLRADLQWGNRFLFMGREWLKDLRLYDFRNRMYQPELGRFLQPDPKQFKAGDYNLYRFCRNDPVNSGDPFGFETLTRPEIDEQVGNRIVEFSQFVGNEVSQAFREDPIGTTLLVLTVILHIPEAKPVKLPSLPTELPGFRPPPGTRIRPPGVPSNWRITPTEGEGGTLYTNPQKPNETVRVMPGNPNSPYPNSRQPYVRQTDSSGSYLDPAGNRTDPNNPTSHIPLEEYNFIPPKK